MLLTMLADYVCHNKSNIFIIQHTAGSKNKKDEKNDSKMNSRAFSYNLWDRVVELGLVNI